MPAYSGALVLLKIGNQGVPVETFSTVGGMRTTRLIINRQQVNATDVQSGAWRDLAATDIASLRIQGSGLFTDDAAEAAVRTHAFNGGLRHYEFYFGNGDKIRGGFMVNRYERGGEMQDAESFSLILESSGTLTYTVG